jgi:beta-N-acetylhexosaminidase
VSEQGSVERLAATCLLPGFRGPGVPAALRPWLERGIGGVVLFGSNIESRSQLRELTTELRAARPGLLVMTDEEGGDVTRLEAAEGSSYPGNLALGRVDEVALTERVARSIAAELADVGVNVDLAPVADVNTNPQNPVIGVRSFGSDAELAARHVAAFVRGLQGAGVAACAKHFPGHGDTNQDSHLELPSTSLREAALVPFRAAVAAGVRSVMTAHIRVVGLDDAPATLSPRVLGILRDELGFEGAILSDAVEMRAIALPPEEAAVQALVAGVDGVMLGAVLGLDELERMHRALVDLVPEERLAEAAARIEAVALEPVDGGPDREAALEAAERALLVEGDVLVGPGAIVVELVPEPLVAAGPARHGLGGVRVAPGEAVPAVAGRELVLVVREPHRHEWEREAAEALVREASRTVVVETGLPGWRPAGIAGYLATFGGGRVSLEAAAARLSLPAAHP